MSQTRVALQDQLYGMQMPSGKGMFLELEHFPTLLGKSSQDPIFVNDFDLTSVKKRELLSGMLLMRYDGDSLDIIPSCECRRIRESGKVGVICSQCNTPVLPITERKLESSLWVKPPSEVAALINPAAWIILSQVLTHSGVNILKWLTDSFYRPDKEIGIILKLQHAGVKRGLNWFYHNFDSVMELLFKFNAFRVTRRARTVTLNQMRDEIRTFIAENRDRIFTPYLPLPSKLTLIIESAGGINYTDTSISHMINAVNNIVAIETSIVPISLKAKEHRTIRCVEKFADYYWEFCGDPLGYKYGWIRRHIIGSRMDFTARAVIISISEPHHYEDIKLPWGVMINLFKLDISNHLLKDGRTPNEIHAFIESHIHRYSPYMENILTEIIANGPGGKIPCLLQRNPTLNRGNIQRLYITGFFTDPTMYAIGLSVLVLAPYGADFDGDELNLKIALDLSMARVFDRLAPHLSVADLNKPRAIAGFLALPTQVLSMTANYLNRALW